jgi:hypothetical protein
MQSNAPPVSTSAVPIRTIGHWLVNALLQCSTEPNEDGTNVDKTATPYKAADTLADTIEVDKHGMALKQGARSWRDSRLWQPHAVLLARERIHQQLVQKQNAPREADYPSFLYLIAGTMTRTVKTNMSKCGADHAGVLTDSHRVVSYVGASFNPMLAVKHHNLVSRNLANRQKRVTNWRIVVFTGPLSRKHVKVWRDVWRSKRGVQSRLDLILQFVLWTGAWLFSPSSSVVCAQIQERTLNLFQFLQTKRGTPEFEDWFESFRFVIATGITKTSSRVSTHDA